MSDLPRLFVSHSSLDTDLTRQVCNRLAPASTKPGYDILVDYTELKPGVDWPRHLHEYMAHCHAAVLLLSRNAAASPWVLKEATILAWRRSLDPSFQLFPVCLTDVDDALLEKQKFGPLLFGLIQKIRSADPEIIANAIRTQVGQPDVRSPTPFDRLVGRLTNLLSQVGPETLKEIAEKMSIQIPAWRPDVDRHTQYVTQIARRVLSEDMGGFKGVDELIDALSFTPGPDNVKQIFSIIAHYWVDAQAAGRLPQLLTASERRAAALNGARVSEFTAHAYVRRAHPLSLIHTLIPIVGGAPGNLLSHVTQEICTWMRKEGEKGSDEEIIADLRGGDQTYYAVLPGPIDDESLTKILGRFPTVMFILWTGELLERDEMLTHVEWMEPMLDLNKEQRAYRSYKNARKILDRMGSP
jgi:hypothetical protein